MMKKYRVPDHIPIIIAGNKLFGFHRTEVLKAVHPGIRQKAVYIGSFEVDVCHMVGKVHQGSGLQPCFLFIAPVGELTRDGKNIGSNLRIAKHIHRVSGSFDLIFQGPNLHRWFLLNQYF